MATQTLTTSNHSLLRNILTLDMVGCAVSGIGCLILSTPLAEFLAIAGKPIVGGIEGTLFIALIGLILLVFAVGIGWAISQLPTKFYVWEVIGANIGWVVFSALLLLTSHVNLGNVAAWVVLIQADVVLVIALAEIYALRRKN